jgi:DNA invertase Pin-like site-specific DNA recombinase
LQTRPLGIRETAWIVGYHALHDSLCRASLPCKTRSKSLTESIDTTTPGGVLIFHVFGALAQFERDLIRERTKAGVDAARVRGRQGGRPTVLRKIDPKKLETARRMIQDRQTPVTQICQFLGIGRTTFYRLFPRSQAEEAKVRTL